MQSSRVFRRRVPPRRVAPRPTNTKATTSQSNLKGPNIVRQPRTLRRRFMRRVQNAKGALQDIADTIKRALNRPAVVLVLVAVVLFWIDHHDKNGFVHRKCDGSTSGLCKWMLQNFDCFAGMVVFAPALYDLPQNIVLTATFISLGAIILLPPMEIWVYAASAFALHTYFTSRVTTTRIFVIIIAIIIFLIFKP
nr:TPA_asm: ORF3 [Clonorsi virus 1]